MWGSGSAWPEKRNAVAPGAYRGTHGYCTMPPRWEAYASCRRSDGTDLSTLRIGRRFRGGSVRRRGGHASFVELFMVAMERRGVDRRIRSIWQPPTSGRMIPGTRTPISMRCARAAIFLMMPSFGVSLKKESTRQRCMGSRWSRKAMSGVIILIVRGITCRMSISGAWQPPCSLPRGVM
jgi:hypothetical protein